MKIILWAVVGAVIVAAAWYAFVGVPRAEAPTSQTLNEKIATTYAVKDFVWRIENALTYEETMPKHIVFLDVKERSYRVGEYLGCAIDNGVASLEPNELTRMTCWFAGGGDHVSVFKENDVYVVKHRWIQESGGPDVNAAPQGPWENVVEIE